ncbi:MAG TPA: class I SAM-dependent methyltransferase [Usitatibacter sp.]|jgi:SAM-dependent methyltransferase|nr:class I SAM-dependent methyltransferase [Usitatibacter sp.]
MIRCPGCSQPHGSQLDSCPHCGFSPRIIADHPAWAPEEAFSSEGFEAGYFADLARLEAGNFWFRARNALVAWALRRYFPDMGSFLEIGCGTGFVLAGVAEAFPEARLVGSEVYSAGLRFAAERVPGASFVQMDARRIPYEDEFDVIGAFDVIEHIAEDEAVLANMRGAVRRGGGVLITVPQHPSLWSASDEYARHVRRYTARELHGKVARAGLEILRSTSFVALPLPAMMLSRLAHRDITRFDPIAELTVPAPVNAALEAALRLEHGAIRAGLSLPFGGSRLVVARRSSA